MNEKLLILEGNEELCRLLQKSLHRKGIKAYCFTDPIQGMCVFIENMAKKDPFTTVYIDCDLTGETGQKTAQNLRSIEQEAPEEYSLSHLRLIGMTNRPEFGTDDGKRFEMDEVVGKPIGTDDWQDSILNWHPEICALR